MMTIEGFQGYIGDTSGPFYPDLGVKVAKLRAKARNDPSQRRAHGDAVLEAIYRLNRAAMNREVTIPTANCASGTNHNTGDAILKAIRARHVAIAAKKDTPRSDKLIQEFYVAAILSKWDRGLSVPDWFKPPDRQPHYLLTQYRMRKAA